MVSSSGTYAWSPTTADLSLDILSRIGVRGPAITRDHMRDVHSSANLVLQSWNNKGVNLWAVDLQSIPLVQGVATYLPPANTVMVLDAYLRTYQMGSPVNVTPAFITTNLSASVAINLAAHGLTVGEWVNIVVPVSIGGIVLFGFYQVATVPGANQFTITAASAATSSAGPGGVVPAFTTIEGSLNVSVNLPNHGVQPGQPFIVQVATIVGGITVSGSYAIQSVTDANNFVIPSPIAALSNAGPVSENTGLAQLTSQLSQDGYEDRFLNPISRTEYAAQANKTTQAPPTTYWFDRLVAPQITLWQVPDANGPYALNFYRVRELQDFTPSVGQSLDASRRFLRAFVAEVAADVAIKYPPDPKRGVSLMDLQKDAANQWALAGGEDRERVPLNLRPVFSGYTR